MSTHTYSYPTSETSPLSPRDVKGKGGPTIKTSTYRHNFTRWGPFWGMAFVGTYRHSKSPRIPPPPLNNIPSGTEGGGGRMVSAKTSIWPLRPRTHSRCQRYTGPLVLSYMCGRPHEWQCQRNVDCPWDSPIGLRMYNNNNSQFMPLCKTSKATTV